MLINKQCPLPPSIAMTTKLINENVIAFMTYQWKTTIYLMQHQCKTDILISRQMGSKVTLIFGYVAELTWRSMMPPLPNPHQHGGDILLLRIFSLQAHLCSYAGTGSSSRSGSNGISSIFTIVMNIWLLQGIVKKKKKMFIATIESITLRIFKL